MNNPNLKQAKITTAIAQDMGGVARQAEAMFEEQLATAGEINDNLYVHSVIDDMELGRARLEYSSRRILRRTHGYDSIRQGEATR